MQRHILGIELKPAGGTTDRRDEAAQAEDGSDADHRLWRVIVSMRPSLNKYARKDGALRRKRCNVSDLGVTEHASMIVPTTARKAEK